MSHSFPTRRSSDLADNEYVVRCIVTDMKGGTASDSLVATFAGIGVGTRRWIREFKEYRPWTSAEQFQREIGKYVRGNPKEVSRLWRYVVIK